MIRYVFMDDEPLRFKGSKGADPQVIGEAIAMAAAVTGGEITPAAVVDVARPPESVLHPHFEWDDAIAAERFRLDQARSIIRCVRVDNIEADGEPARAFVSINHGGTSYRTIQDVQNSAELQAKLLAAADRDLEAFQHRYRMMKEICAAVGKAREVIARKRTTQETRAAA